MLISSSIHTRQQNIVEGYALRRYKNEFIHYLFRPYGSSQETIELLELLFETESLKDEELFKKAIEIPQFMKEPEAEYSGQPGSDSVSHELSVQTANHKSQTYSGESENSL